MLISAIDNGPGIPESIRATLFEPFVTHGKSDGTGLGMAIVKKIIDAHGGTITFDTEEGKGTSFNVHLPQEFDRLTIGLPEKIPEKTIIETSRKVV